MEETRMHPIWKEAASKIAARVEAEGYGFEIPLDDLFSMLEIKKPHAYTPWRDAKKSQFDFLENVEALKRECLHRHNICLYNRRGRGYEVLHPDQQVTDGYERHHDKMRAQLRRGYDVLVNVDVSLLSGEGAVNRDRNLARSAFIMSAANKRRIPPVERKEIE